MMDHREPPNWVKGYADCNLDMTFEALRQIVRRDVEQFNDLYARRQGRSFRVDENTDGCAPFFRVKSDADMKTPPEVRFSLEHTSIRVNGGGHSFFVRPEWDGQRCRLMINYDHPAEPWQISQRALSRMFFDPRMTHP